MNNANSLTQVEIIDAFRKSMREAGIEYSGEIIPDNGKINRFDVDGDLRGTKNGFYSLFTDGLPAGNFGSWKLGVNENWCAKAASSMTNDERKAYSERLDYLRSQREKEEKARNDKAAQDANVIWDSAGPVNLAHPYLVRKGVSAHGIRQGRWTRVDEDTGRIWLDVPNALLVPIKRGKVIVSLQAIFPNKDNALKRDKDFLPGGAKRGLYFRIGDAPDQESQQPIVICEGYATGATIHEATGHAVCVAFDANNLVPVAERVREFRPKAKIIIAADNDQWTTAPVDNPGVHFARMAADRCRGYVAVPEFSDLGSKPTDFNDLALLDGKGSVADQITKAGTPPPPPPPPAAANDNTDVRSPLVAWAPTPVTVDYITPLKEANSKGKPLATIENFQEMLDRLGVTIRYNVIKKEEEILIPGLSFSIDNQANASLAWLISWCNRFMLPTGNAGDFITYLSDQNLYNPVASWISSKPWDGQDRLTKLFNTVKAVGEAADDSVRLRKECLMRRWLVSAVAAAFSPDGVSAHGVLVFQGDQYLGKTKWFTQLVPEELGVIADGMLLKPDDKDSVKQTVSNWLVELGELDATFRKSDIAQLKAFLTKKRDVLRRAYARRESEFARRTIFFASVNPKEYLHDPTGNRRFWTIECEALDHSHEIDMQQLWAQVRALYDAGESWYLSHHEVDSLNETNRSFEIIDPVNERIASGLLWDQPQTVWRWATATEVLIDCGMQNPTQAEATRAANIIRSMNNKTWRRSGNRRELLVPHRRYYMPSTQE